MALAAEIDYVADQILLKSKIALKANLASPTLTGVPAAPTAVAGTSTTQVATTAFVAAAFAAKFVAVPASAVAAGTAGQIAYAAGFLYVCVAANTWERVAIATW